MRRSDRFIASTDPNNVIISDDKREICIPIAGMANEDLEELAKLAWGIADLLTKAAKAQAYTNVFKNEALGVQLAINPQGRYQLTATRPSDEYLVFREDVREWVTETLKQNREPDKVISSLH